MRMGDMVANALTFGNTVAKNLGISPWSKNAHWESMMRPGD